MKIKVQVGIVQLPATIEGKTFKKRQERTWEDLDQRLNEIGREHPDLVLLGEYANLCHRSCSTDPKEYIADEIPGPRTRQVAMLAKRFKMNIALPMFARWKGALSSYVLLLNRQGEIVDCYQKAHPTMPEQELGVLPGALLQPVRLDFGTVGIMTCMDIEYPEVAQVLMLKGADLLLFPHVQAGWGEVEWEIRYRSRAIDTGLYLVSACYGYPPGVWRQGMMLGRSGVVGRDGIILADMGRSIGSIIREIDLDEKRRTSFFFNQHYDRTLAIQASRRPDLYGALIEDQYRLKALQQLKVSKKP
ncbi:MAG: carbon-nitrogen hydrolase family protein [bacterium]